MVKLPISDYVYQHYREQGIEFTFRQQAHLCWKYSSLLKDQLRLLREILKISDDEKLNTEITERLDYEEKACQYFWEDNFPGCIYIVYLDDQDESGKYDAECFSSAQNAVLYGKQNCVKEYKIIKRYLFDQCPGELLEDEKPDKYNTKLADYTFTSDGEIKYGCAYEYQPPFDDYNKNRFENMFLNIRTPFGIGDIVMAEYFDRPAVVYTDYDYLKKLYERHKNATEVWIDDTDNLIGVEWIEEDGRIYSDLVDPFDLLEIDSWEDKKYWDLLQMLSKSMKAGVDMWDWQYLLDENKKHHKDMVT